MESQSVTAERGQAANQTQNEGKTKSKGKGLPLRARRRTGEATEKSAEKSRENPQRGESTADPSPPTPAKSAGLGSG